MFRKELNLLAASNSSFWKEVLDIYNESVRVQCPKCDQGHQFEGIKGDFSK